MLSNIKRRLIQWFPWFWYGKAFFNTFYKTKALGIALIDAKGKILQNNEQFAKYLGQPHNLFQTPIAQIIPQLNNVAPFPLGTDCDLSQEGAEFDVVLHASGIEARAVIFPLHNIFGRCKYYILYLRNTSKHIEQENAIKLSEAKFKAIFQSVSDLIIVFDKHDGTILEANEGLSRVFNCLPINLVGRNIKEVGLFDNSGAMVTAMELALQTGSIENVEIPIICNTGERFIGLASINQINYGTRSELIMSIHDITESKLIEQLLSYISNLVWLEQKDKAIPQLLMFIANQIGCDYILASKVDPKQAMAKSIAFIKFGKLAENIQYDLEGTPCYNAYNGNTCIINSNLQQQFPMDKALVSMQAESYIGVPIIDSRLAHIGIVAAIHTKSFKNPHLVLKLLQIAAKHIGNDMERQQHEHVKHTQETKYRQLFDNLTSGLALHEVVFNTDGLPIDYKYLDVNPAFEEQLGTNREKLIGHTVLEIWPATEKYWIDIFCQVGVSGESCFFEDFSEAFGKYYRGFAYATAPNQFAVIFHDVTDLHRKEQALRERQHQLNTIFENTPAALILVNEDAEIVQMNPAGSQIAKNSDLLKVKGPQLGNVLKCINSYVAEGGCGHAPACKECKLRQMLLHTFFKLADNERTEILFRQATSNGYIDHYFMVTSTLVSLKGQKLVLITMEEITSQKKMELDLVVSRNKAMESDRLKSAFFNNLSHEIRTPLNGIVGFSNLLRKDEISKEEISVFVGLINENSNRLLQIMNNVIEVSKISSGNSTIIYRHIDIQKVMDVCNTYCKDIYTNKKIEVKWIIKGATSFECDYNATTSIVTQLMLNALKFTASGYVQIRWYVGKVNTSCMVIDSGIGIDNNDYQTIFTPFKQIEDGMTRTFGGVGIGLAIVKGYLDLLGGTISVKSEKGYGSLFRFSIPTTSNNTQAKKQ